MADSAMVSAYFLHKKIEDFDPRLFVGINLHPLFLIVRFEENQYVMSYVYSLIGVPFCLSY